MDDPQRFDSFRKAILSALAFACCVLTSPVLLAHHMPGHHGSAVAECDCPPGVELVSEPWVRLLPPTQPNTAAYMTLRNLTDADLQIVAAESPVARVTELHDHVEDTAGMMRMREVEAIVIPAHGKVELKPGGLHVMLIDLLEPLQQGQPVPITLYVGGFQDLQIRAPVRHPHSEQEHSHHGHSH